MKVIHSIFPYWIKCYCYNNSYILFIRRHIKNNIFNSILLALSIPFMLINYLCLVIYEYVFGYSFIKKLNINDYSKSFKYEIALVCISKNEGPYIKEWIEYYKLIGFSKFYFYDNESEDNTYEVLQPYINSGLVEYKLIKGKGQQLNAYNDAIKKHKHDCKYMAFLDMDEYLFPMSDKIQNISETITQLLSEAGKGASGLSINWCIFGSSNLKKRPKGLITENYIHRGDATHWGNFHVKTICNPRRVKNTFHHTIHYIILEHIA